MLLTIAAVLIALAIEVAVSLVYTGAPLAIALATIALIAILLYLLLSWDIKNHTD